jgi:formate dehydrogenase subunit gamma
MMATSSRHANRLVVERYNFRERLVHTLASLSYVYLLLTGLAFWTPALYWIAVVLGGGFLSRMLHPWVGVFFAFVVTAMFTIWRRDMRTVDADRQWRKALLHYIRNDDTSVPAVGRFNYGQKQFFWIMVWAGLVLLVSGIVLWVPDLVPLRVREIAVLAHSISALLTIGAFIVHLYMGLAVVPGSLHAILHGDVSESWARHHHRIWLESLRDRQR